MGRGAVLLALLAAVAAALLRGARAVTFDVPGPGSRCVSDVLRKDQLATGEYAVQGDAAEVGIEVKVTGPRGEEVFTKHRTNGGRFGFTANAAGDHKVCFKNTDMVEHRVTIRLRSGVEAKDLAEIVQRDHLQPLSAEVLRIEETVRGIRTELLELKIREAEMRETNETINSRVTMFSLFSVAVVSSLGVWQILYLKSYFLEKKLI